MADKPDGREIAERIRVACDWQPAPGKVLEGKVAEWLEAIAREVAPLLERAAQEKKRRVYWQDLTYAAMNAIDSVLGTQTTEDTFKDHCTLLPHHYRLGQTARDKLKERIAELEAERNALLSERENPGEPIETCPKCKSVFVLPSMNYPHSKKRMCEACRHVWDADE